MRLEAAERDFVTEARINYRESVWAGESGFYDLCGGVRSIGKCPRGFQQAPVRSCCCDGCREIPPDTAYCSSDAAGISQIRHQPLSTVTFHHRHLSFATGVNI